MTVYWKKGEGSFFNWKDGETVEDIVLFLSKKKEKNTIFSVELTSKELDIFWNLNGGKELLDWLVKKKFKKDPRFKAFFEHLWIRRHIIELVEAGAIKAEKKNEMFMFSPTEIAKEVYEKYFKK